MAGERHFEKKEAVQKLSGHVSFELLLNSEISDGGHLERDVPGVGDFSTCT